MRKAAVMADVIMYADETYQLIATQAPRFDTTFLAKDKAYPSLKDRGPVRLCKLAWYLHFKEIVRQESCPGDAIHATPAAAVRSATNEGSHDPHAEADRGGAAPGGDHPGGGPGEVDPARPPVDGAQVEITVETRATANDGFPDDKVRVVTENARTLKFTSFGFEDQ